MEVENQRESLGRTRDLKRARENLERIRGNLENPRGKQESNFTLTYFS